MKIEDLVQDTISSFDPHMLIKYVLENSEEIHHHGLTANHFDFLIGQKGLCSTFI